MLSMEDRASLIIGTTPPPDAAGDVIGLSREGRPVRAFRFGRGPVRVSLLAGCHADEPVGPRLLRRLAGHLSSLDPEDPLLATREWWIVPHANPDGEERNRSWQAGEPGAYDLVAYLAGAVRELPGDDMEFGFPRDGSDEDARPENRAVHAWWRSAHGPFHLHVSLHGMAFGGGPWFLIEPAWRDRCGRLKELCAACAALLGWKLHDVERGGEKGFFRIERGFATRPDSTLMAKHFRDQGDEATARFFRPSSMEAVRSLGGDPLTLVSEVPLFITPGVGDSLGPPDPRAEEWKKKIDRWRVQIVRGRPPGRVRACARSGCLEPMPVEDQMRLQWTMVAAGLEEVEARTSRTMT
ncbi:MAG TPA: M14 family zinc carboxypeptidase [Planctomycetota bacterium]|nr:M14 family zinc carboxypeptidase [Planctomycetota bacterium]